MKVELNLAKLSKGTSFWRRNVIFVGGLTIFWALANSLADARGCTKGSVRGRINGDRSSQCARCDPVATPGVFVHPLHEIRTLSILVAKWFDKSKILIIAYVLL